MRPNISRHRLPSLAESIHLRVPCQVCKSVFHETELSLSSPAERLQLACRRRYLCSVNMKPSLSLPVSSVFGLLALASVLFSLTLKPAVAFAHPEPISGNRVARELLPLTDKETSAVLSPTDILEIHQVLNKFCRALDGKDFSLLNQVFLPKGVANYTAPYNLLNGTAEIESTLGQILESVTSQHMMGTWVWYPGETADMPTVEGPRPKGNCGLPNVKSELYFIASMYGTGKYYGQSLVSHGYFLDNLVKVSQNGSACAWRIASRQLVHQGTETGNDTIFQQSGSS